MLRRRLMKRLSKSASDISNCKKKTYSTSPEEEAREFDHEGLYGKRAIRHDDDEGNNNFCFMALTQNEFAENIPDQDNSYFILF